MQTPHQVSRHSLFNLAVGVIAFGAVSASNASATPNTGDPLALAEGGATGYMSEVLDTLGQGRYWIEARYRIEYVEMDKSVASGEDGVASTLRTVLGFESGEWNDFRATIEFEDISIVGNQQFNDTISGKHAGVLPVVADPSFTGVNEVFVDYTGLEDNKFRLGRQTIVLDNARFVGNVGWRQNDQTFDAFSVTNNVVDNLTLFYSYLHNVNNIKGMNVLMASHLVNAKYNTGEWGNVTGYAYLLDYDSSTTRGLSTTTIGARWTAAKDLNDQVGLSWALEGATQSDAGNNKTSIDANYYHGEVAAKFAKAPAGLGVKLGMEVLEGNKNKAGDKFTTPLATGHKFNGWADQFLATPNAGLEDAYVGVTGKVDKAKWAVTFHQFDAQDSGMSYGDEIDAVLTYPCSKRVSLGIKAADFSGDDGMKDVTKVWLWLGINP